MRQKLLKSLEHGVIVSVQADTGEPLHKPACMVAMAMAVVQGGAVGLRLANPENIRAVREFLPEVPIIGLTKPPHPHADPENHVYITPSLWTAESVLQAGADMVAMDATPRPRPTGDALADIVARCRERFPNALLMADIATEADADAAAHLGFDVFGTTLSGYTAETLSRSQSNEPDFDLLAALTRRHSIPVLCEGRIWEPHHVTQAFELGAYAVVIGSAITRPHLITKRFVQAVPRLKSSLPQGF